MPQYDNPQTITIALGSVNFGSNGASSFKLPKGKRGRLVDVSVIATTSFTAVSTGAFVKIGTSADDDAYASLGSLGALAATDTFNTANDPDAIINPDLPADTQIGVVFTAPTGGSPAGVGLVSVVVDVF